MARPHDLDLLPAWGPYSKLYAGCSHLPDLASGLRFDLSLFPGFYRGRLDIPNVLWESGYVPDEAAPDLSYWRFRHRLDGEQVRVEAAWCALPEVAGLAGARLLRATCINDSSARQTLALHLVAGAQYPNPGYPKRDGAAIPPMRPLDVLAPPGSAWCDSRDFAARTVGEPGAWDGLQPDGRVWREFHEDGCVGGGALALERPGDALTYRLQLDRALPGARLLVRARVRRGSRATLTASGALSGEITWHGWQEDWQLREFAVGDLAAGSATIRLELRTAQRLDLDLVAVIPADGTLGFAERRWNPTPSISPGPRPEALLLRYPDLPVTYGLWWQGAEGRVREWIGNRLDVVMREKNHEHVQSRLQGDGDGHWLDVSLGPVGLEPHSRRELWAVVAAGGADPVARRLAAIDPVRLPELHDRARSARWTPQGNPAGTADEAGQCAMAACTLTNVTYPIYIRRDWVRHYSPGKWWDCVYTWDAGFVGLGLLELAEANAWACLDQYLMPDGDEQAAWLQHGTPLPVQIYLAHELWNRTRDLPALRRAFPGLRQMHRFLVGRLGTSDTARLGSGLLNTWTYFYNSGGWDDYAPQVHVHANRLADRVTPMVNTAHAIRCAHLLAGMAGLLGEDAGEFNGDAQRLGAAVQAHAWDEESGYFGYVEHDAAGQPIGVLRHASGANFNQGLDGASPLVAGICTPAQEARLLGHLADPTQLWCEHGLTTVSQAAPYFRADGYWNGTVWMAHQWFMWKTLLDLGQAELAARIALTGLRVWRDEIALTGNCYEHFPVVTGRGAGWHHFSSLSSPVLSWFAAYHRPGRITGGHQLWIDAETWDGAMLCARLRLHGAAGRSSTVLVCTTPGACSATWNGQPVPLGERHPGCWEISLPADGAGELRLA